MRKVRIKVVTLGNLKFPVNFGVIENWNSEVFQAEHVDQIQALPDAEGDDWTYTDYQLERLLSPDGGFDYTIGIINAQLEYNYYIRRLTSNICVLSLHETGEILQWSNLSIENFIIRNLYELTSVYLEGNKSIPESTYVFAHDETRCCIFDMNANKADIVFSTESPRICEPCKARIMQSQVSKDFLPATEKELKRLKKALYYRLAGFIKAHPIAALIITTAGALTIDVLGNYIYDVIKAKLKLFQG